jgi:D-alanyl-D-alanine carboxypeptidase/D-alanyl-D-alanine-endopeptidase (penicillin-binding protein 4)
MSLVVCWVLILLVPASGLDGKTEIEGPSITRLTKSIGKILNTSILKNSRIGIQIISLDSGEVVYEQNPEMSLNPASNTKLVTSAAALVRLKPEYQFTTAVYTNARLRNGVLAGEVN